MERLLEVNVRKHHVVDIMKQVSKGRPDALPSSIPQGIRDANTSLVDAITRGTKMIVVENEPDAICIGCPSLPTCDFKD